jgi:hypothetical protein
MWDDKYSYEWMYKAIFENEGLNRFYNIDDIMEHIELEDWQKQILNENDTKMKLQPKQKEMIEMVLSKSDFVNIDISAEEQTTLIRVLVNEEYTMEDRKVLNLIRGLYLNG